MQWWFLKLDGDFKKHNVVVLGGLNCKDTQTSANKGHASPLSVPRVTQAQLMGKSWRIVYSFISYELMKKNKKIKVLLN